MAAKTNWHRYGTKLRHCHPVYSLLQVWSRYIYVCGLFTSLCVSSSRSRSRRGPSRRCTSPPCPRSTARLQSSPIGRVESFRSWSSQLFRGRPGGRRHVRSGGRLSDTLTWSLWAMFAGVTSSSRATCRYTEMRRQDRRWDSEVRPVRCRTSSFLTRSYHRIPSSGTHAYPKLYNSLIGRPGERRPDKQRHEWIRRSSARQRSSVFSLKRGSRSHPVIF